MTQIYDEQGRVIPVTVVQAGPCVVVDVKTIEKNGYSAVQLGFGERKAKNASKALLGTAKKAGINGNPPASLREIRMPADPQVELGSIVSADIFAADDYLDISGITKGRGFHGWHSGYLFQPPYFSIYAAKPAGQDLFPGHHGTSSTYRRDRHPAGHSTS